MSVQFRELLSTLTIAKHTLYVPKPVIEEVVSKFSQIFDEGMNDIKKGSKILARRLAIDTQAEIELFPDRYEESIALRRRLEGHFHNSHCAILDYPNTTHENLAMRAIARRKPFKNNGVGYLDTLIWETTLKLALSVDGQVTLLSNNKSDFGDAQGDLHADLIEELTDQGLSPNKVILVLSLADFINRYVLPTLPKDSLEGITEVFSQANFEEQLREEIEELYTQIEWEHEEFGLEKEHEREEVSFSRINKFADLKLKDVRRVSPGRFLLNLNVEMDCDLDVDIEGGEGDDFTYSSGTIYGMQISSDLNLVVDISNPDAREIEILSFGV